MRYAKIRKMDISNGEGVGISLFVQGCHFHCHGCFNQETWDFDGGKEWTPEIREKFLELANRSYIKRISILGGEPLADENVREVFNIIQMLNVRYPEKKVWLYTGYKWEDIIREYKETVSCESNKYSEDEFATRIYRAIAIYCADIVVDGRFQLENQDLYNKSIVFAGSTNQRIIDSSASFSSGKIILYNGEKYGN